MVQNDVVPFIASVCYMSIHQDDHFVLGANYDTLCTEFDFFLKNKRYFLNVIDLNKFLSLLFYNYIVKTVNELVFNDKSGAIFAKQFAF